MVFKIMKAAASFYAVAYNENKQQKGQAEKRKKLKSKILVFYSFKAQHKAADIYTL